MMFWLEISKFTMTAYNVDTCQHTTDDYHVWLHEADSGLG